MSVCDFSETADNKIGTLVDCDWGGYRKQVVFFCCYNKNTQQYIKTTGRIRSSSVLQVTTRIYACAKSDYVIVPTSTTTSFPREKPPFSSSSFVLAEMGIHWIKQCLLQEDGFQLNLAREGNPLTKNEHVKIGKRLVWKNMNFIMKWYIYNAMYVKQYCASIRDM